MYWNNLSTFFENDIIHFDVFQNYEICCKERDSLSLFLERKGIKTIIQWAGMPIHHSKLPSVDNSICLPKTDKFFKECLMLPMNSCISDDQIQYVINAINEFYV